MIMSNKSLSTRINKLLNNYYANEQKKIPRLLAKKNIEYHVTFDDELTIYLRIYQELTINDSEYVLLYKVYPDIKNRRFKIIYFDDYEKVLFAENADAVLSILEILFINQSNKRRV